MESRLEDQVKACYSTWSTTYFDEYYGEQAPYPPVQVDLVTRLLNEHGARTVLDAGCGPASMMRRLPEDLDVYGFDLTPEMVTEAKRVLAERGVGEEMVWQGSVLDPTAYRPPDRADLTFDAAICVGVLPHIPETNDAGVIGNLRDSVVDGGLVVVEARNALFSLFTLNRYSHEFFMDQLIPLEELRRSAGSEADELESAVSKLEAMFRMDQPPVRKGKQDEPGYDEILSRNHNPLVVAELFRDAGLTDVRTLFFHFHSLPPMFGSRVPELFRRSSEGMENPTDWRGYFMASAFMVAGRRQ